MVGIHLLICLRKVSFCSLVKKYSLPQLCRLRPIGNVGMRNLGWNAQLQQTNKTKSPSSNVFLSLSSYAHN